MIYLETARLIIRPLNEADFQTFKQGYETCLPSQNRFDEGRISTDFMSEAWYCGLLDRRKKEAEEDYSHMLNIFRKSDGASLGYCDITPHRREDFQYARIGYTLHNPHWGQGYGTETARALISIGFDQLHLHRLEAHVNLDNPPSKHVLRKAGFQFECIRKGFILEDGIWTDNEVYYINNEHWTQAEDHA